MKSAEHRWDQLIEEGYCLFEGVLDGIMLERLRQVTDWLLDAQTAEDSAAQRSTGSMISVWEDPLFAELVSYPRSLEALRSLGFLRPKFSSGFVIGKPPHSPALFWHQDWWGWDDQGSYTPLPQQLFLMYYLVDTTPENGCLRVLAGSHLKRHPVHDITPDAHTDELRRVEDPAHPAYRPAPGELSVPVRAGDLVVGDSRLLHSSHSNSSEGRRTVITLWYHPLFQLLSDGLRAHIGRPRAQPESWPSQAWDRVTPLLPVYEGDVEPVAWNRVPGPELR